MSDDGKKDEMIDREIGHYVIVKKLGEGGMGTVYLARHATLPATQVAIKVLRDKGEVAQAERVERLRQEALIAAAVGDPRVARPIHVGRLDDGTPFIVMEYVEGRSLQEILKTDGPLTVATALRIAYRVADTMALAHARGVIHRDLKPSNMMIGARGEVRLLDFGVARISGNLKLVHTAEGIVLGTPGYTSPEAVLGGGTDGRSDVFSLGVTLFVMLTGEQPFPGPDKQAIAMSMLSDPPPRASTCRPAALPLPADGPRAPRARKALDPIPAELDALIERTLIKERERRMTMAELRDELVSLLKTLPVDSDDAAGWPVAPHWALEPLEVPSDQRPTLSNGKVMAKLQEMLEMPLPGVDGPAAPPPPRKSNTGGFEDERAVEAAPGEERRAGDSSLRSKLARTAGTREPPAPAWLWRAAAAVVISIAGITAAVWLSQDSRSSAPTEVNPPRSAGPPRLDTQSLSQEGEP